MGSQCVKAGIFSFWPNRENTKYTTVPHAQHFVDGIGYGTEIFDPMGIIQLVTIGIGVFNIPVHLCQDGIRIIANPHRRGEEAVGAVAVEPALHHINSVLCIPTKSNSGSLSRPICPPG